MKNLQGISHRRTAAGVRCVCGAQNLELSWYGPDTLRVRAWKEREPVRSSLVVVALPSAPPVWDVTGSAGGLELRSPGLTARIEPDGSVAFLRDGRVLLAEKPGGRSFPENNLPNPDDRFGAAQVFALEDGEALYGLGQYQDGVINRRGRDVRLIHGNVTIAVPFLLSTGGWGILWDNASHTEFHDGADGMAFRSEVAEAVDYYVCSGATADEVVARYRHLTGAAPLFPRAFHGFIQCKERYRTAEELADVVREHRKRGLPLDVIVQDWLYWGPGMERWSGMRHDPATYGDLAAAVRAIHDEHAKVMISIWPRVGTGTELGKELAAGGHLFEGRAGTMDKVYDAFSEGARAIYWRHVRDGLFRLGVDAWWMDGTEPEFEDCHDPLRHKASLLAQRDTAAGSWARVLNAYSLATTRGVYENQRATTDAKRVFILTRSAFAGQQRYAAAAWSGDISANWATLRNQIPAGLNYCMAGLPYWTTDNGAFFVRGRGGVFPRGVDDPAFREFFLRWFQYSCFCPLMRSHGTQTPREIWHFGRPGEPVYDSLAMFARLRMRLLPYSYSLAAMTTFEGYTPMRGLAMDFGGDPATHDVADQFLYGPALMACPVTQPMVHAPSEAIRPFQARDLAEPDGTPGALHRSIFDGIAGTVPGWQDKQINPDYCWSGNRPRGATGDSYRMELAGSLVVPDAPEPALRLLVAGRVRLDVAGDRLLDEWTDGPPRNLRIPLDAYRGRTVPLRVVYGHEVGDATVLLGWDATALEAGAGRQERTAYLPRTDWFDFWTGARLQGGRRMTLPAPMEHIPVLARAGSILPLGPVKQWHDEIPDDPLEIRVYPGADGEFTLYEDAGDGYAYEKGEFATVRLAWDNAAGVLRIGARQGAFPGMRERRTFRVVLVRPGRGVGADPEPTPDAVLEYGGKEAEVAPGRGAP